MISIVDDSCVTFVIIAQGKKSLSGFCKNLCWIRKPRIIEGRKRVDLKERKHPLQSFSNGFLKLRLTRRKREWQKPIWRGPISEVRRRLWLHGLAGLEKNRKEKDRKLGSVLYGINGLGSIKNLFAKRLELGIIWECFQGLLPSRGRPWLEDMAKLALGRLRLLPKGPFGLRWRRGGYLSG